MECKKKKFSKVNVNKRKFDTRIFQFLSWLPTSVARLALVNYAKELANYARIMPDFNSQIMLELCQI